MFYKVIYQKKAEKFLKKNKLYGIRFFKAFKEISEDKNNVRKYDIKKFIHKDFDNIFRIKIVNYRAVFRIIEDRIIILVIDIDSRGSICKK